MLSRLVVLGEYLFVTNDKGFNENNLKNAGISLENIKKRIKHLNGTFSIDSTLGKGATILIDIPLMV
ncbi:hypothetical protein [Kordia sp.]|uniref:hypothetical protein n=1 Tax=Kordia sp. TaxID=1965332 RepID=UPI003B5CED9A